MKTLSCRFYSSNNSNNFTKTFNSPLTFLKRQLGKTATIHRSVKLSGVNISTPSEMWRVWCGFHLRPPRLHSSLTSLNLEEEHCNIFYLCIPPWRLTSTVLNLKAEQASRQEKESWCFCWNVLSRHICLAARCYFDNDRLRSFMSSLKVKGEVCLLDDERIPMKVFMTCGLLHPDIIWSIFDLMSESNHELSVYEYLVMTGTVTE